MFFFLRYQVQECPLVYYFFYCNIFIYFIQITLNVLYDLGVGGGGGGGRGKGEPSYLEPTGHDTLPLSSMNPHFFLVKSHNTLVHVVDLLRGVVGI